MSSFIKAIKQKIKFMSPTNKKLVEIIYRSEIKAPQIGASSVISVFAAYRDEMKINPKNRKLVRQLDMLIKEIAKGKPRSRIYENILPNDVVLFLREAENKSVRPSMIFEKYAPIKRMGDKASSSVRRKLYVPIGIFVAAIAGLSFMMGIFANIKKDGIIDFGVVPSFIIDHFVTINLIYGLIFGYFLLLIPEKLPLLKKVFQEINGMLALATMEVYNSMSYSSSMMIAPIRRQFGIKTPPKKQSIGGLVEILYREKMISDLQAAEIKIQTEYGDMSDALAVALSEKREKVEGLQEVVGEIVSNMSMLLLAPPLIMAVSVLLGLIVSTTRLL